jgi:hypothetical protein
VAVFERVPDADGKMLTVIRYNTDVLTGSEGWSLKNCPAPDPEAPHCAPLAIAMQSQATLVSCAGRMSDTDTVPNGRLLGPLFQTVTEYTIELPGIASESPSVFEMTASAIGVRSLVSVAWLLKTESDSNTTEGTWTLAVFTNKTVADGSMNVETMYLTDPPAAITGLSEIGPEIDPAVQIALNALLQYHLGFR